MTIREVIYKWRHFGEDLTGYTSDDTSYSDQAIYRELLTARAKVVKDIVRRGFITDKMYQSLLCVMFEEVDANECGLIPQSGCKILKSTCPIPTPLKIKTVTDQLGKIVFDVQPWNQLQGKLQNSIESIAKAPYAAIRNINGEMWLYLINTIHTKNAVAEYIAEDPIEMVKFCGNKEAECNPMEVDFHTDLNLIDTILKVSWAAIMQSRQSARPDIINNDSIVT